MKNQKSTNVGLLPIAAGIYGLVATIVCSPGHIGAAEPPGIINHQGRIAVNGTNFDGTGQFKFALTDAAGTTTHWSNDGTGSGEPATAVEATVTKGHYAVPLGDTAFHAAMTAAIPADVFTDNADVHLRIWVSVDGGTTFEELTPARRISSSGFALSAARAESVKNAGITASMIANNAVNSAHISSDAVNSSHIANGAVGSTEIADDAVGSTQIADDAVGGAQIASKSIWLAHLATTDDSGNASGQGAVNFTETFGEAPVVNLDGGIFTEAFSFSNLDENGFDLSVSFTHRIADGTENSGNYASTAIVNGKPAVAYYNNSDVYFVQAKDAQGNEWDDPVLVEDENTTGYFPTLLVVNGRPAIAYNNFSSGEMRFKRADDADGTAWTASPVVIGGTVANTLIYCRAAIIGGYPAVVFWDTNDDMIYFARASDANGDTWPAPTVAQNGLAAFNVFSQIGLSEVDANPAVAFIYSNNLIYYTRANNVDGTSWSTTVPVAPSPDGGAFPSSGNPITLAVVNGRPGRLLCPRFVREPATRHAPGQRCSRYDRKLVEPHGDRQ